MFSTACYSDYMTKSCTVLLCPIGQEKSLPPGYTPTCSPPVHESLRNYLSYQSTCLSMYLGSSARAAMLASGICQRDM